MKPAAVVSVWVSALALSGCSLWPWHHPSNTMAAALVDTPGPSASVSNPAQPQWLPPNGDAAAAVASTTAVATDPVAMRSAKAAAEAEAVLHGQSSVPVLPAPAPAARVNPADVAFQPFSQAEWQQLWSWYQPLAVCTDRYMASAGINGQLLGLRLVQLDQDRRLLAAAAPLLGAELPQLAADAPLDARAALASKAVWLLMQDQANLGLGAELARKALARYALALVAGPACPIDSGYHALLGKALHP